LIHRIDRAALRPVLLQRLIADAYRAGQSNVNGAFLAALLSNLKLYNLSAHQKTVPRTAESNAGSVAENVFVFR
jgi:hypothetical protein